MKPAKQNIQPRGITFGRQEFNTIEKRMVYLVVNQLDQGIEMSKDLFENMTFTIPVSMLGTTNYQRIKEAAERLSKRTIGYDDPDKEGFDFITPFPRVSYRSEGKNKRDKKIDITVFADVMPYLAELKKGYTKYRLKAALQLQSRYSQHLYEMLSGYKDIGKWPPGGKGIEIEDLKRRLGIEGKYEKIYMFKKRVLNAAKKEINEKTDISFKYELHKTGRKYTHISFRIRENPENDDLRQIEEQAKDRKARKCLQILDNLGVSKKEYRITIVNKKQDEFWKWYWKYQESPNRFSSPAGHLLTSLGLVNKNKPH